MGEGEAVNILEKITKQLQHLTDRELAELNFNIYVEASERAVKIIEQDVEKAIDNIKKKN